MVFQQHLVNATTVFATNAVSGPTAQSWLVLTHAASWSNAFGPAGPLAGTADAVLFTPPRPRAKPQPRVLRAGRRAVRRSIDLYARFRGVDEVRRFIKGEEIVFEGQRYRWHARKTKTVLQHTMQPDSAHIPYALHLTDRRTGRPLASGCVVFPALPVLDQLLALAFHIADPDDELALLKTTNWTPRLRIAAQPIPELAIPELAIPELATPELATPELVTLEQTWADQRAPAHAPPAV